MPRVPVIDPHAEAWLNGRQACKLAGCAAGALQRAALFGFIRAKLIPGVPPRYHRGDVEKFARSKPPAKTRPKRSEKPGPTPDGQTCPDATKKPRGPKASEVVPKPPVVASGSGRKDETPPVK